MDIKIESVERVEGTVKAPGSKSYSHRAIIAAGLSEDETTIMGCLNCDDTRRTIGLIIDNGADIAAESDKLVVHGFGRYPENNNGSIYTGLSRTTLSLGTGIAALNDDWCIISGDTELMKRPTKSLIDSYLQLGVKIEHDKNEENPHLIIHRGRLKGGIVKTDGRESSQHVSSLLMAAPYASDQVEIFLDGGLKSRPYLDITIDVMKDFGVNVERYHYRRFLVSKEQEYKGTDYEVEGDYSSASYFMAAAAVTRGRVRINNLNRDSLQADKTFTKILGKMGCSVLRGENWVEVQGNGLEGITIDMGDCPDLVPTMAVTAAFAEGRTIIENVEHLRYKETDRLAALAGELSKAGIRVEELGDGLVIEGGEPKNAVLDSHGDHRMAMSLSVLGLAGEGCVIKGADCVEKSYPDFFKDLKTIVGQ